MTEIPARRPASTTRALIKATRTVQTASAAVFASFVIVHLAAPVSAAFSPGDSVATASDIMLIGREYYQGGLKEIVVVVVSAGAHVVSGIVLRALKGFERASLKDSVRTLAESVGEDELDMTALSGKPPASMPAKLAASQDHQHARPRQSLLDRIVATLRAIPRPTTHQMTGYALVPVLLHHSYIHRLVPAQLNLTPFFNYSFVHHSVRSLSASKVVKVLHGVSYGVLASLATYHAVVGVRILSSGRTSPKSLVKRRSSSRRRGAKLDFQRDDVRSEGEGGVGVWQVGFAAVVGSIGLGVARIMLARDQNVPTWLGVKYDDVLKRGWRLLH
ncbi:hypothetical protein ACM66B_004881 [Microbotryomycetes sp. NB124-2]